MLRYPYIACLVCPRTARKPARNNARIFAIQELEGGGLDYPSSHEMYDITKNNVIKCDVLNKCNGVQHVMIW